MSNNNIKPGRKPGNSPRQLFVQGSLPEILHTIFDDVWQELFRVMKNGAIACINIGDATRTINDRFQLFANHSCIQKNCPNGS